MDTYSDDPRTLWRIEAPKFVAGVTVQGGVITGAAPILKKYVGMPWDKAKITFKNNGWHGVPLGKHND